MKRRITLAFFLLSQVLFIRQPLFAWDGAFFDLFQVPLTARAASMGGIHAALVDGVGNLFSNPAGFRSADPDLSLAQAMISIYDSGPSIIDEVLAGEPAGTSATKRAGLNILGPLSLGYVGNGLGFGIFSNTRVRYWTWGDYPSGRSVIEEDLVLISGYAFTIPLPAVWNSSLDLGFSVPLYATVRSDSTRDVRGLLNSSLTLLEVIATEPFTIASGAGLEVGVLYSFGGVFSAGVVARNLTLLSQRTYDSFLGFETGAAPSTTDVLLPMDLTVGLLWNPSVKELAGFLDGFTLMVDYRNIFDFLWYPAGATDPLLHISAGVELRMLGILYIRAGFYQLLPSFGVELDLSLFKLNMAIIGRELSQQPGGYPIYGYLLGLSL